MSNFVDSWITHVLDEICSHRLFSGTDLGSFLSSQFVFHMQV